MNYDGNIYQKVQNTFGMCTLTSTTTLLLCAPLDLLFVSCLPLFCSIILEIYGVFVSTKVSLLSCLVSPDLGLELNKIESNKLSG